MQSVALRLVSERESEIGAFHAQQYFSVDAVLQSGNGSSFPARLTQVRPSDCIFAGLRHCEHHAAQSRTPACMHNFKQGCAVSMSPALAVLTGICPNLHHTCVLCYKTSLCRLLLQLDGAAIGQMGFSSQAEAHAIVQRIQTALLQVLHRHLL